MLGSAELIGHYLRRCKTEIRWFVEFQEKYKSSGRAVMVAAAHTGVVDRTQCEREIGELLAKKK